MESNLEVQAEMEFSIETPVPIELEATTQSDKKGSSPDRINHNMSEDAKYVSVEASTEPKSKRSLKKLAKLAKWEQRKKIKRLNEREKKKLQRAKHAGTEFSRKALKKRRMDTSTCRIGVIIDLSFDDYMIDKDIHKTVKQIHGCYSINRRQPQPLQFHVTSFSGESSAVMAKHDGFSNWDIKFHKEPFEEVFEKDSLVYLTSDSKNVIQALEPEKFYIIGGIVDHNSRKGLCLQEAISKGINHARLPIDEFLKMKTRKVLSIVHVFEILANVAKGVSWADALLTVIPERKQAEVKEDGIEETNCDNDEISITPNDDTKQISNKL